MTRGPRRHRVRWTHLALADLDEAIDWIQKDDLRAAARMRAKLRGAIERLATFPQSGRIVPERAAREWREVVVPPYRVIYAIAGREVHVLRVWHSRRDLRAT